MFDCPTTQTQTLTDARIVTPEGIVEGSISFADGRILGLSQASGEMSLGQQFLVPGVVDLHTDHVEKHVYPRSSVRWNVMAALMAHDGVVISGGTTTVYDSLSVGISATRPERREMLGPLIDGIVHGITENMFRAEHLLHLRCEIADPATHALVDANIDRDCVGLVSLMDHTPGDRQCFDIEEWVSEARVDMGLEEPAVRALLHELLDRQRNVAPGIRAHIVAASNARGLTLMSHDDRTEAHVDEAKAEGVHISEFPTTLEAARHARAQGLAVVAGAPNYLRGGSQSGNVAVKALLEEGLVDALASDYVPRSPLDAAFAIAADQSLPIDLPAASAMVSATPARLAGLNDRGEIAQGQRADLVAVRLVEGQPQVTAVWREGIRVF